MATNYNIGFPFNNKYGQISLVSSSSGISTTNPFMVTRMDDVFVPKEFFTTGVIESWGKNDNGELGDANSPNSKTTPEPTFYNFGDFRKVDSGDGFAAGLTMNGDLYVWGNGKAGIFGDGQTNTYDYPRLVSGHKWYDFACGHEHMVGLKQDGSLYMWGKTSSSAIAVTYPTLLPSNYWGSDIPDEYVARKVWAGWYNIFILAIGSTQSDEDNSDEIDIDGRVYSLHMNYGTTNHIIGRDGSSSINRTFYDIDAAGANSYYTALDRPRYPRDLSTGPTSTGIIGGDGSMYWMGDNRSDDGLGDAFTPDPVNGAADFYPAKRISTGVSDDTQHDWKRCSAGRYFQGAIKDNGTLWMWGQNTYGQLGLGNTLKYNRPQKVGNESNWRYISCGEHSTLAIKTDGTLWGWGRNDGNYLGISGQSPPTSVDTPQQIGTRTDWGAISTPPVGQSYYALSYDKIIYY